MQKVKFSSNYKFKIINKFLTIMRNKMPYKKKKMKFLVLKKVKKKILKNFLKKMKILTILLKKNKKILKNKFKENHR